MSSLDMIIDILGLLFTILLSIVFAFIDIIGFKGLLILVVLGAIIIKIYGYKEEINYRREKEKANGPCTFSNGITQQQFARIAEYEAKSVKRVKSVNVVWSTVHVIVQSQSKLSSWEFTLYFNDYGYLSYEYYSENDDSLIPKYVGDKIVNAVEKWQKSHCNGID